MRSLILFLFTLNFVVLQAQKENALWLFSNNTAIDFSTNMPIFREEENNFYAFQEGHATICDREGKLLFYTDGGKVYNRNHELMSNSLDIPLAAQSTSSQQCTVIKSSIDSNTYLMLSLNHNRSNGELYLSKINMSLNNGLGDIEKASVLKLGENFTEQLFVVAHPCFGFWVVTHERNNNTFSSFHLEDSRLIEQVDSKIGVAFQGYDLTNFLGSIYISKNNDLVYLDTRGTFEKFKFNPFNGEITEPKLIFDFKEKIGFYKGQFSPDQNLFYAYCLNGDNGFIGQFDFTNDDDQKIKSSLVKLEFQKSILGISSSFGLGLDNKIYFVSSLENNSLGVINNPNQPGLACNFDSIGLKIPNRFISKAIPTPLVFKTPKISNFLPTDTVSCSALNLSALSNILYDSIKWSTGASSPSIQLQSSGNYQAELFKDGCVYQDSIKVEINYFQNEKTEAICENDVYNYKGIEYLIGDVIVDSINGVNATCDTVLSININKKDLIQAEQSIGICEGDSYLAEDGKTYLAGDTVRQTRPGLNGQCDTLINKIVKSIPLPEPTISAQDMICFDTKSTLTASNHQSYLWNTGATTSAINVGGGDYEVMVIDTLNCQGDAQITITERPEWLLEILDTLEVVSGESYTLQIMGDKNRINAVEILPSESLVNLNNGNLDISIRGESALYKLIFKDDIGCLIEQDLYLKISKEEEIIAPNIICLNASNLDNRLWRMHLGKNLTFEEASIFDRWGNRVFLTNDAGASWNGTFGGKPVVSGLYFYVIKVQNTLGKTVVKWGDVMVVE